MDFRRLKEEDTQMFCDLILDMYAHLDSIEWFTPMPFDFESVKAMINDDRFAIFGMFDGPFLCAVSSMDYKCGKLIGVIDFPNVDTDKLVEFGFVMVHSRYRGNGIMKCMVREMCEIAKNEGFLWAFSKVHKDNLASSVSFKRTGFLKMDNYNKPVKTKKIKFLLDSAVLNEGAISSIETKLKNSGNADIINVDYEIYVKKL